MLDVIENTEVDHDVPEQAQHRSRSHTGCGTTLWGVHRDSNGDLGESYTK
jgi:hypothetical protein